MTEKKVTAAHIWCIHSVSIWWAIFWVYLLSQGRSGRGTGYSCCAELLSRAPLFCDPVDCSPPGSAIHGVFQTRTLACTAVCFCRGSSRPRDRAHCSCVGWWSVYRKPPGSPLDRVREHRRSLWSLEIYTLGGRYRTKREVRVYHVGWLAVEF